MFGLLGDVEGIPLPLKWTRSSPRRRVIIDFFKNTITGTRYFSASDHFGEEILRNNGVINMESTTYTSGLEHWVMATSREDIIIFL